jgi:hypothetical protein
LATPAPEPSEDAAPAEPKPAPDSGGSCTIHIPEFLGDQAPIGSMLTLPHGLVPGRGVMFVPAARWFKISDNDSPQPRDRTYFSFNYFYNLYGAANQFAGAGIQHTRIHREVWGWEFANDEGTGSIGLRLPLNTYNAANTVPGLDGTSTDIGDLTFIFKHVLWRQTDGPDLVSAGLAVTPPTGPGSFAGSNNIKGFHETSLQPFCGWIWAKERFYLQGFTAVDAPTDLNDVVVLSNDLAAGYFVYNHHDGEGVSALVPTLEVHVNTPLNHRGILGLTDKAGTPDSVDLTAGVQFEYRDHTSVGLGFDVPVAGPRMFDFQVLFQYRCRY